MKYFTVLCILLAMLVIPVFASTDQQPDLLGGKDYLPDIDTFMQIGSTSSPSISPDGKTIYYRAFLSGLTQIYRASEENKFPYQLSFFKEGAGTYVLSPDGRYITVLVDEGGNEQYQINLMDAKTGRVKPLTANPDVRYGIPIWSPDSKRIYFRANAENPQYFHVYEMDLITKDVTLLVEDNGYFGPSAISPDGELLLYYEYMDSSNMHLHLLNLKTREKVRLTQHEGDVRYAGIGVFPDENKILCITNDNENGAMKLAWIDFDTKKPEFFYDADTMWEVDDCILNPDQNIAAVIVNEHGYGRLHLLDLQTNKELPVPENNGIVTSPSFSKHSKIAFSLNTPTTPGDVYTWDWKTKTLSQITVSSYAGIDPSIFVEPQLITYKSFDGLEIPAFVYLPPNWEENKGNIPFIIHFHGGPESQFRPYFQRHFNYLLQNGYGMMAPNIRGSSGYGREYREMDNYKKRMDSVKDGYYAAKYLIDQGYTKKGKIGVKGGSYGGFMVMALLTEYPDMWGAGKESIGIVDFVNFLKNTSSYRRALRVSEYGPLSDEEFLRSISPIHKLDRITAPLMVVHGKNDPRVPVSEAYLIIDNLEKRGVSVEALIFPDEGHGVKKRENLLLQYRAMVEFFDKHMKNGD